MKTYKVLSALIDYPGSALLAALPELRRALDDEALLPHAVRSRFDALWAMLAVGDLLDLQEAYVGLFDRVRSLSLNLFEHVHGESRDRGQALVDLRSLYEARGLVLAANELPDYLPAFLEFLSRLEPQAAQSLLAETGAILQGIGSRLAKRGSPYAVVFDALLALAGRDLADEAAVPDAEIRAEDDPATLDAAWEEQPAFGPGPECSSGARGDVSVVRFHKRAA